MGIRRVKAHVDCISCKTVGIVISADCFGLYSKAMLSQSGNCITGGSCDSMALLYKPKQSAEITIPTVLHEMQST